MFSYEKRLEYPIHIKETNPKLAKAIISQYWRTRRRARRVHALSVPAVYDAL